MFATWKLDWTDPNYGTGPEEAIVALGGEAQGIIAYPDVVGGTILGKINKLTDFSTLSLWQVTAITDNQALEFAIAKNPEIILQNGELILPSKNS